VLISAFTPRFGSRHRKGKSKKLAHSTLSHDSTVRLFQPIFLSLSLPLCNTFWILPYHPTNSLSGFLLYTPPPSVNSDTVLVTAKSRHGSCAQSSQAGEFYLTGRRRRAPFALRFLSTLYSTPSQKTVDISNHKGKKTYFYYPPTLLSYIVLFYTCRRLHLAARPSDESAQRRR
jgi:hypothetical protein